MRRRILLLIVLVLGAAALAATIALRLPRRTASPPSAAPAPPPAAGAATQTPRGDVTLDTRRQQLIGVRTVTVRRTALSSDVRAAGTVTLDETRQSEINTRVDGWIRELYADYTGRPVRRGEPLFTFYSPDVIATQNEYLLALRGRHTEHNAPSVNEYSDRLVTAARDRLLRLDMTSEEIDKLEEAGRPFDSITFRSPVSGVIVEKAAVRGMRVMTGTMLFRVADLSNVWVEAEIYERDLGAVRMGVPAAVTVQAYPQRTFNGRVTYIAPIASPETRTVRARITLPNPGGLLKPNMAAIAAIRVPQSDALVVPPDALVETGTQHVVFVGDGNGHFTPRDVRVGRRTNDDVEILSGLSVGERVAASGTFFLDSESQLRGALQNYESSTPPASPALPASSLDVAFRTDPDPPKVGEATLLVTVKDANGTPVNGADVNVLLFMPAMPSMNMPAMKADARLPPAGDGVYRGTGQVMTPGRWDVTVTVAREGRTLATRQFALMAR